MNAEQFQAELDRMDRDRKRTDEISDMMHERTMRNIEEYEAWRAKWKPYEWIGDPPWCFLAVALFLVAGFVLGGWIAELAWGIACHARG